MRAILQRVSGAAVVVKGETIGRIGSGLLILLGIHADDSEADAALLADKTAQMRIFSDEEGRFQYSLLDSGGAALVVSQFTLHADLRRGRRPSFTQAASPELAAPLVETYSAALRNMGIHVEMGQFGAMMQVSLTNEGPVTIILDSETFQQPRRA
jgi:D-tyrosyl-tRNA(Tyr) deacylase